MGSLIGDRGEGTLETLASTPSGEPSSEAPTRDDSIEEDAKSSLGRILAKRYVLRALLGSGGMGMVFEAEDQRLVKRVAVKLLTKEIAKRPEALGRFKQEAIAAAQIGHHSIVDVTDFDQDEDGTHFIVMELIKGVSLHAALRSGRLTLDRALGITARVAQALAQAHERGIIHRDLKPANIMLTQMGGISDLVKILDFGISKVVSLPDDVSVTMTGTVVGTPRYMAPEQGLPNKTIDGRADIYALGGILYEMATGVPAYESTSQFELIHQKLTFPPRPPSLVHAEDELPLALDRLVLKALAKEADDRFSTMDEFAQAIRDLLESVSPETAALVRPATPRQAPANATPAPAPSERALRAEQETQALSPSQSGRAAAPKLASPGNAMDDTAVLDSASTPSASMPHSTPPVNDSVAATDSRRRPLWLYTAMGSLMMVALGSFLLSNKGDDGPEQDTESELVSNREQAETDEAMPVVTPPSEAKEVQPRAANVEIEFVSVPDDAVIEVDGKRYTENPVQLPKSDGIYAVRIHAPGRTDFERQISGSSDQQIEVSFEPIATAPISTTPAKRSRRHRATKTKNKEHRLPDSPL